MRRFSPHLFGSVGDDRCFCLWDTRKANENVAAQVVEDAHQGDINCLEFNPHNQYLVATGGSDNKANVWDIRNLKVLSQPRITHQGCVPGMLEPTQRVLPGYGWCRHANNVLGHVPNW